MPHIKGILFFCTKTVLLGAVQSAFCANSHANCVKKELCTGLSTDDSMGASVNFGFLQSLRGNIQSFYYGLANCAGP